MEMKGQCEYSMSKIEQRKVSAFEDSCQHSTQDVPLDKEFQHQEDDSGAWGRGEEDTEAEYVEGEGNIEKVSLELLSGEVLLPKWPLKSPYTCLSERTSIQVPSTQMPQRPTNTH